MFPLVKQLGERVTQILDSPVTQTEKLPAEKLKQQIVVRFAIIFSIFSNLLGFFFLYL